ncbi:EAL domain-containing protein [Rhodococcus sp. SGAir0479]|uniref:EAL domain-containing protein n=1 Tax=Rhodococcus sp. SGAir0479 TaxID=2567884 RepID=UPI0010CCB27B|nr:EAL domain-containing protein [Rhodococcus sp. SGAir0479]QCQ93522.1 EAL domain-containing protein [Rhodococcus sp. SGAir0479]
METTAPGTPRVGEVPTFHGVPIDVHHAPVRSLSSGAVCSAEVQLRGVAGSSFADPAALRTTARAMGETTVLDRLALTAVRENPVDPTAPTARLLLLELDLATEIDPHDLPAGVRPVVAVTEEAVMSHPARALERIAAVRAMGLPVAVDDVGEQSQPLALLSLVEPEVIFTAADLIARPAHSLTARAAHAIASYRERSDATVIARGVDSDLHRRRALGVGARYGTGLFLPPAAATDLSDEAVPTPVRLPAARPGGAGSTTPFGIAARGRRTTRSLKRLLVSMSKMLEMQAAAAGPETIVLGTFQHAEHFTPASRARWAHLARQVAYTGIYGVGVQPFMDSNVHHAPLDSADPLVDEWSVVVLGSHFCCVLAARDLHTGTVDRDREFEYVVSYDRGTVTDSAHAVLSRFTT